MIYFYGMTPSEYFEKNLDQFFKKKELKIRKKEILQSFNQFHEQLVSELEESNSQLVAYFLLESYRNYQRLVELQPLLQKKYDKTYHRIYIYARYFAHYDQTSYSSSILEKINEEEKSYYENHRYPKEMDVTNPIYLALTRLAFLDDEIEKQGMEHKKMAKMTDEEREVKRESEKVKKLIY